jgi:hypothetical protein
MRCQPFVSEALVLLLLVGGPGNARPDTDAVLRSRDTEAALRHAFSREDAALLDEVQQACFQYFWREVGSPAQLVRDRKKAPVSSVAAVGFQLSSLAVGVERGWITRAEGRLRAETVLRSLTERKDNKKFGVYVHYPDMNTGGLSHEGFEVLASTVDHALLLAGALTAAEYFGGEVEKLVAGMVAETNWKAFARGPEGFLSMGWKPDDAGRMDGSGTFLEWRWQDASDEERLIYFLAVGSPNPAHAIDPEVYYRLRRPVRRHEHLPPYVVSWPGALFTYFFSHCWIDYRALGADDPRRLGVSGPRVDWFENSRRAVLTHRRRCMEQAGRFKTLAADRWGLSACAAREGYIVPEVQPNLSGRDRWFEGTVAPYAAASAIMFTPVESLDAIRAYRSLRDGAGRLVVWRGVEAGGYGFADSFNLDQGYASDDYVGIDQGPMLLAIENARTGLIWKLFMGHELARRAVARLRLRMPVTSAPAFRHP